MTIAAISFYRTTPIRVLEALHQTPGPTHSGKMHNLELTWMVSFTHWRMMAQRNAQSIDLKITFLVISFILRDYCSMLHLHSFNLLLVLLSPFLSFRVCWSGSVVSLLLYQRLHRVLFNKLHLNLSRNLLNFNLRHSGNVGHCDQLVFLLP
jgi:hypothetical protein